MKQDIITPNNQRGAIRPLEREDSPVAASRPVDGRVQPRPASSISMDGMMSGGAHKSLIAPAVPTSAPRVAQSAQVPQTQPAPVRPTFQPQSTVAPQPVQQPTQQPPQARPMQDFTPQPKPVEPVRMQPSFDVTPTDQANQTPQQVPQPVQPAAATNPVEKHQDLLEAGDVNSAKAEKPQKPPKSPKDKKIVGAKKYALIAIGIALLLVAGYIAVNTLIINDNVQALISKNGGNPNKEHTKDSEGQDEDIPPSNAFWDYKVAAEYPRALYIDKINVAARILPMAMNTDGSVQAPLNIFDSGWYTGSVKPGEAGAAFIDGHASGKTRAGLFAYLDTLAVGDMLRVEKGDGTMLNFKVVHTETVPLNEVDMKKALMPYDKATKGLNLMTCTGEWIEDKATYDHRVMVYTELVE